MNEIWGFRLVCGAKDYTLKKLLNLMRRNYLLQMRSRATSNTMKQKLCCSLENSDKNDKSGSLNSVHRKPS